MVRGAFAEVPIPELLGKWYVDASVNGRVFLLFKLDRAGNRWEMCTVAVTEGGNAAMVKREAYSASKWLVAFVDPPLMDSPTRRRIVRDLFDETQWR